MHIRDQGDWRTARNLQISNLFRISYDTMQSFEFDSAFGDIMKYSKKRTTENSA